MMFSVYSRQGVNLSRNDLPSLERLGNGVRGACVCLIQRRGGLSC